MGSYWHRPHSMPSRVYATARRPSVRLSVCHIRSPHAAAAGLLLRARPAGDIDRLLQQRRANAGSATLSAYVVAEHKCLSCEYTLNVSV